MLSRDELPNNVKLSSSNRTQVHLHPECFSDSVALFITRSLRFFADTFFKKRYGHRAVVLETVAAVPGMVGGMLAHFKSLRKMIDDGDFIKELLEEADNERMHLMTFIAIAKPSTFERLLSWLANSYSELFIHSCIFFSKEPLTEWSDTLKKKQFFPIPNIYMK